jgi:hypothetical protein
MRICWRSSRPSWLAQANIIVKGGLRGRVEAKLAEVASELAARRKLAESTDYEQVSKTQSA